MCQLHPPTYCNEQTDTSDVNSMSILYSHIVSHVMCRSCLRREKLWLFASNLEDPVPVLADAGELDRAGAGGLGAALDHAIQHGVVDQTTTSSSLCVCDRENEEEKE